MAHAGEADLQIEEGISRETPHSNHGFFPLFVFHKTAMNTLLLDH
jgi:hypothetical protein